jgi:hypothetical protein
MVATCSFQKLDDYQQTARSIVTEEQKSLSSPELVDFTISTAHSDKNVENPKQGQREWNGNDKE